MKLYSNMNGSRPVILPFFLALLGSRPVILPFFLALLVLLLNRNFYEPLKPNDIQDTFYKSSVKDEDPHFVTPIYIPAKLEKDILDNAVELGYASKEYSRGCTIWKEDDGKFFPQTQNYLSNLERYKEAVQSLDPVPDLLKSIQSSGSYDVCTKARPHPTLGLEAFFERNQLSHTASGYVEPITTPMRDPKICIYKLFKHVMSLDYLVHDFEAMCRKLKPTSRRVLIDLGASLDILLNNSKKETLLFTLLKLYEKFGFNFDHIYAFEMTPEDPTKLYSELLPEKYFLNYHWINVGVSSEEGHKLNPLHSILKQLNEDDFVVLKIDIDTPEVELPLVKQILEDKDGIYHRLIDQFYFEHHVRLDEMKGWWGEELFESVKDSLDLFYSLRLKGIPAHFWP